MIDCTIEGQPAKLSHYYQRDNQQRAVILCDERFVPQIGHKLERETKKAGMIQPMIVESVTKFRDGEYGLDVRIPIKGEYKSLDHRGTIVARVSSPNRPRCTLALTLEEVQDVWGYITTNQSASYVEILVNTRVRSTSRVGVIMQFLHDSGIITKARASRPCTYKVNLPFMEGRITKLESNRKGEEKTNGEFESKNRAAEAT